MQPGGQFEVRGSPDVSASLSTLLAAAIGEILDREIEARADASDPGVIVRTDIGAHPEGIGCSLARLKRLRPVTYMPAFTTVRPGSPKIFSFFLLPRPFRS